MEKIEERMYIKLDKLKPNPYQPPSRVEVPPEIAKQFGLSILEQSLLQLPVVRMKSDGTLEVGDGWLRLSGFKWLCANGHPEYSELPVVLRGFNDQQMADLVIETNDTRKQLNPIERAWYYSKYLADFKNVTQAEFAKRRGISQGELSNIIRLLDLPEKVQQMIISHEITESHGRVLLQLKEPDLMLRYAQDAIDNEWAVATLDAVLKTYLNNQKPKLEEIPPPAPPPAVVEEKATEEDESSTTEDTETETEEENGEEEVGETQEDKGKSSTPSPAKKTVNKPAQKSTSKTPAKVESKKTTPAAAPPSPPTTTKPAWKRKLVLEEMGNYVSAIVMLEGKFPVIKPIPGNLEAVINELPAFLKTAEASWNKEVK